MKKERTLKRKLSVTAWVGGTVGAVLVLLAVTFVVSIANTNYMIQYGKHTKNREEQEMLSVEGQYMGEPVYLCLYES